MIPSNRERTVAALFLAVSLLLTLLVSAAVLFFKDCDTLREEFLRLHILANSDSEEDQRIKLAVRDHLLSLGLFTEETDKSRTVKAAQAQLPMIEAAANSELLRQGSSDTAKAELVRMYFTTRVYENVTLPAGYYDAVRITIGEGAGKNWWCVLYPPLCIPAAAAEEPLDILSPAEQNIVTEEGYEVRFFLVELYENFCRFLFGE